MRANHRRLARRCHAKQRRAYETLVRVFALASVFLPSVLFAEPTVTTIKSKGDLTVADQNVALAVQFLKQHGDPGIAAKLEAHIEKGYVRWADSGGDADTDASGVIVLPPHRVGIGAARKQVFDPVADAGNIFVLAITLTHELVHAEQHGGGVDNCAERLASNVWGYAAGYKPHEIEGWTKGLQGGLRWLRTALAEYSKIVDDSRRYVATRRIELMVGGFRILLSDFRTHNYFRSRNGAKWQALDNDLAALEADLKGDATAARQRTLRRRCFDQCGMLARLADELRIRVGEAKSGLERAQRKLESVTGSHAHVDQEIQKHEEQIERSRRQQARENVGEQTRRRIAGIAAQARKDLADAELKKAKLPSLEKAREETGAAQAHHDKTVAEHEAARQKWLACMKQCLHDIMFQPDGTRTEFPVDALPPGFGVEGNEVVYDSKYQRDLGHRFTFDMLKWKSVLDSRAAKLPTGIEGDELPCPETTPKTGIKVLVKDVFGDSGFREKSTNGIVINVTDTDSVQVARVVTGSSEEHDLIELQPGSYVLTLDIGRYVPSLPESCTDGYRREFKLEKGQQLDFTAIVYSTNVAKSGQSVGPRDGACIRLIQPR